MGTAPSWSWLSPTRWIPPAWMFLADPSPRPHNGRTQPPWEEDQPSGRRLQPPFLLTQSHSRYPFYGLFNEYLKPFLLHLPNPPYLFRNNPLIVFLCFLLSSLALVVAPLKPFSLVRQSPFPSRIPSGGINQGVLLSGPPDVLLEPPWHMCTCTCTTSTISIHSKHSVHFFSRTKASIGVGWITRTRPRRMWRSGYLW